MHCLQRSCCFDLALVPMCRDAMPFFEGQELWLMFSRIRAGKHCSESTLNPSFFRWQGFKIMFILPSDENRSQLATSIGIGQHWQGHGQNH